MSEATQLVRYDAMCRAIAAAFSVDEVKDIRDKARAIEVYARQAKNFEAELTATRIRQRAERRAGELLAEMPKAKGSDYGGRTDLDGRRELPSNAPKTLADLGISKDQSTNWQKLAKVPLERFEDALQQSTVAGMRGAIREVIAETLGPPPDRSKVTPFRRKPDPNEDALSDLSGAITRIATLRETDMALLASLVQAELLDWHLRHGHEALKRIAHFISALEGRGENAA